MNENDDQPSIPPSVFGDATLDESEQRARQALGLNRGGGTPRARPWGNADVPGRRPAGGGNGHHKPRFVQDGEVPVVMVSGRPGRTDGPANGNGGDRSRLADAEAAIARERLAREQIERALKEARDALHELQTRLGHAELARDEAIAAERAAVRELEALRGSMAEAPSRPAAGNPPGEAPRRRGRPPSADSAAGRRRAARETASLPADQPVRWWASGGLDDDEESP